MVTEPGNFGSDSVSEREKPFGGSKGAYGKFLVRKELFAIGGRRLDKSYLYKEVCPERSVHHYVSLGRSAIVSCSDLLGSAAYSPRRSCAKASAIWSQASTWSRSAKCSVSIG